MCEDIYTNAWNNNVCLFFFCKRIIISPLKYLYRRPLLVSHQKMSKSMNMNFSFSHYFLKVYPVGSKTCLLLHSSLNQSFSGHRWTLSRWMWKHLPRVEVFTLHSEAQKPDCRNEKKNIPQHVGDFKLYWIG